MNPFRSVFSASGSSHIASGFQWTSIAVVVRKSVLRAFESPCRGANREPCGRWRRRAGGQPSPPGQFLEKKIWGWPPSIVEVACRRLQVPKNQVLLSLCGEGLVLCQSPHSISNRVCNLTIRSDPDSTNPAGTKRCRWTK